MIAAFISPPPETVAVFTTLAEALAAMFAINEMVGYIVFTASASEREQVSVASTQFQAVPAIDTAASPRQAACR